MRSSKFKNQSIELVGICPQTNQFYLTQQAKHLLFNLDKPIAVVTIAGLYRTGKSFLVNKLIKEATTNGFKVGSTTNSVTKGLYIWGKPITIQTEEGQIDYLLIDSEGIGSCEQELKYDTNLLILIFLISSTVVYNSVGAIDEQSLDQLQVVLSLKNCIQRQEQNKPKFIWVLRDFSLQLIDRNGNQMTPNQYLETFLDQIPSKNAQTKRKNQIRRAIKENLGFRSCYTLVRPTLKQEDLANLNKCKIRTQFIGQIEELKDELFSGSTKDIKKINGQQVSGRFLWKTLQRYIDILNNDELPSVLNVWQEVVKQNNNEILDECCERLRKQVKMLCLPMGKQQLKRKLNEIQNKIYSELENRIKAGDEFKIYHKEFIKQVQQINKSIKNKNEEMCNKKIMGSLRDFVKENVNYETIKPTNITDFKNSIQRMKVKAAKDIQAYEYIIQTIIDVNFVVEKKAIQMQQQLSETKLALVSQTAQKKHNDLVLINMKKEYHDALKSIAKLKENQADTGKDYLVLKTQNSNYQQKIQKLQEQLLKKEAHFTNRLEEVQNRLKTKTDQFNESIKKLREENYELNEELSNLKGRQLTEEINNRKEVIFQEKIEGAWEKFNEEKESMKKQVNSYKAQMKKVNKKYEELERKYKVQCEKRDIEKEENAQKEANFETQLKNLKQCISDTKNSYALTFQTMKTNEKIFKDMENKMSSQKKYPIKSVQKTKENLFMDEYQTNQEELKKIREESEEQISIFNKQITSLQIQLEEEEMKSTNYKQEAFSYKKKCQSLQEEIIDANRKFNQCLKEIQTAKEKQRSLYEESIVRLLTNIERRQGSH